ncbi:MAG: hypothetical protein Q8L48_10145 [Archangium sp.]|nr:hypothetical protein [Archangium sp.]
MKKLIGLAVCGWLWGCHDVELPPPPGAGSITGRILVAQPGESTGRPAVGAEVSLIESGITLRTGDDGRFELSPVRTSAGTLRLSSGSVSRVLTLEALNAGPGKTTVLGDVALSQNASVQGDVAREDDPNLEGTLVFLEGEVASTYSNRAGQFLLRDLPTGSVSLAFYRQGYAPVVLKLELRSGERFVADRVVLQRLPLTSSTVSGEATLADQQDSSGTTVTADLTQATATSAPGAYSMSSVPPGVRSFAFTRDGYRTVRLINRVVGVPNVILPSVVLVPGMSVSAPPVPVFPSYDGGTDVTDAGTTTDAGATDAGATDAGATDAGATDAGATDAGATDAGATDAGSTDAGSTDAGSTDAGSDAGTDVFPVALIEPLPVRVLADAGPVQLNGTNSLGTPAIALYAWTIDAGLARLRDGGVVRPSANNSVSAGAPFIDLPVPPAAVTVSLQVTDLLGRVSSETTTGFIVGDRPLALFDAGSLPASMYSGESAIIDATPSRDTVGSNIVSRRWVTSPSSVVTTTPLANAAQLRLDVGTVPFGQQFTVSHYVTNGLGFESLERQHAITLLAGSIPSSPWSVVTAAAFTIDGGTVVPLVARLDAGSMAPAYANTANYDWQWVALSDAGVPPQWAITDPSLPSTTFIPPVTEGPPLRYDFQVTATTRPPLAPGSMSSSLVVFAQDRVRPNLLGFSSSTGTGSSMGTLLTFDEAMTQSFAGSDVVRLPAAASTLVSRLYRDEQLMLVTRPPPTVNELWEFRLTPGNVDDVVGNALVPPDGNAQFRASFAAEVRWTPLIQLATSEQVIETAPATLLSPSPVIGQHSALVLARVGATAVQASTGLLSSCASPPCAPTQDPFAAGLPAGASDTNPLFVHAGTPYFQPTPGTAWSLDGGALPTAPGLVFSHGNALGSFFMAGTTLRLAELDGGAWDVGNAATAYTSAGFDLSSQVVGAAAYETISSKATCVAVLSGTRVVPLTRLGAGNFGVPLTNNPAASGLVLNQVRVGVTTAFTCYFAFLQTDGKVVFENRAAGDHGSTGNLRTMVNAGVSFIDVLADGFSVGSAPIFWLATIESGQLFLYFTTGDVGTRVLPPSGTSLNVNPACVASKPHLSKLEQAVYVTWQEKCAGQPYTVYMRGLY